MNSYIESVDFFKGNNPEKIAEEYKTPLYVYNEEIIRNRMHAVSQVITKYPYTANYSVKANTNIHILKLALEEGINCDAMSEGEIRMLEAAGFPKERIFFVPNNVSAEEMRYAIDRGIMTSLEHVDGETPVAAGSAAVNNNQVYCAHDCTAMDPRTEVITVATNLRTLATLVQFTFTIIEYKFKG